MRRSLGTRCLLGLMLVLSQGLSAGDRSAPEIIPLTLPAGLPNLPDLADQVRVSGESFAVPIEVGSVQANEGIFSYQFILDYDPTLLAVEGLALADSLSDGWTVLLNDTVPGQLIVGAMSAQPLDGEGTLMRLRLRALEGQGHTALTWRQFLFGAGQPANTSDDGQVEIQLNLAPIGLPMAILCEQGHSSRTYWPAVQDHNPGDRHSFALVAGPTEGQVLLTEQGFVYQAAPAFVGEDHFRYRIADAGGLTAVAEAQVMVLGAPFFDALSTWPDGDVNALVTAIDDPQTTFQVKKPRQRPAPRGELAFAQRDPDEAAAQDWLAQGWRALDQGDAAAAKAHFERLAPSRDPELAWAAQSALVALDRMGGDAGAAFARTAELARARSELAPLMLLWDGDTALLAGEHELAMALYGEVLEQHSFDFVDGVSLGSRALTQLARAQIDAGQPAAAAEYLRQLLREHGAAVHHEFTLAQALLFEAMDRGELPLQPLEQLFESASCGSEPCLVGGEDGLGAAVVLAGMGAFRFVLGARDIADLEAAVQSKRQVAQSVVACTVTAATTGFQVPLADTRGTGYRFMDAIGSGQYHPGLDINTGSSGSADCGVAFQAVASGCVRDSSPSNWGSAVIEHFYTPESWYSQYGHASAIYFSTGAAITKGATLGLVGKVGAVECHLHHELRESDHPDPTNADYYSNLSWSNVGDWYDNPTPFEQAHRAYARVYWVDEDNFSLQGSWTAKTGVGHRDDLKYAATTATTTKTHIATRSFLPNASGTHELWVFIPYNYGDSKKAAYRFLQGTTVVMQATVDQSAYMDAWVKIGTAQLSAGTQYKLELASNTGEANLRVALDDALLIRP